MRCIGILVALMALATPSATLSASTTFDPARFLGRWILEGGVDPAGQGTLNLEYRGSLGPSSVFVGGDYVDARGRRCESEGTAGVSEEGEPLVGIDLWCADWSASVRLMLVSPKRATGSYEFWAGSWDTESDRAVPAQRKGVATLSRPPRQ